MTLQLRLAGIISDALTPGEGERLTGIITEVVERNVVLVRTPNGVIRALNYSLPARIGLPVVVEWRNSAWVVTDIDHLAMPMLGNAHYVAWHHDAHEFAREGGGDDVVWLRKEQYTPLMVAPTVPPSLRVRVFPSTVIDSNLQVRELHSTFILDLEPFYGETTRYAVITLDVDACWPRVDVYEYAPAVTPGTVPLALVRLRQGASEIGWGDILDIRELPPTLTAITLARVEEVAKQLRSIRRISATGAVTLYDATDAGLLSALSEASSGDRVITPTASFTADITVASGVILDFSNSAFSGTISGGGVVVNFQR
jgi:hypothetical protein